MSLSVVRQIKTALSHLDPDEVRLEAERPLAIELRASDPAGYTAIEEFLAPPSLSGARRIEIAGYLYREGDTGLPEEPDLVICAAGVYPGKTGFTFYPQNPGRMVEEILDKRADLSLPLARLFPPFREPVVKEKINRVAKENALFSALTAFPNILPTVLSLPWAVGEFASDTAVLTTNQIRLAFLLAAASDRPVGYREQKGEIASIVAGAFGWRAIARELVGKIPLGGGLVPKAAVAYAGTYVAGQSLERYYRIGYGMTREERRESYEEAYNRGKSIVKGFLKLLQKDTDKEEPELAASAPGR